MLEARVACDSPISVELYASIANRKITSEATTTPRPMYIHHMGHLDNACPADARGRRELG